jgi:ribosomal protein S18 acetylase RimI-like enzyme
LQPVRGFLIRPVEDTDLDACLRLALAAKPERSTTEWRSALLRDFEDPTHHLVVAVTPAGIAGYGRVRLFEPPLEAAADTVPRGYYLSGVFVAAEYRRRGIGAGLTEARLSWIRERAAEAWFFTNARNATSIELHRRFGFEEVTRRFSFPGLTFEGGEGILFRLRLHEQPRLLL